jgi:hypothetical protein
MNRYNGLVIVITVHLNTKKYSKEKSSQRSQSVSLCNDSVNYYNVSAQSDPTVILSKPL